MFYPVLILGLEEKITLLVMSLIVFLVEAQPFKWKEQTTLA